MNDTNMGRDEKMTQEIKTITTFPYAFSGISSDVNCIMHADKVGHT